VNTNDDWSDIELDGGGLDPVLHPEAWEGLVARINTAAAPVLARRRSASVLQTLSSWRRPVALGSAGLVAAAALALLLLPASPATAEVSLAEVVMPTTVAAWIEGSYEPTVVELVRAVDPNTP
jgi:hypothetical protein